MDQQEKIRVEAGGRRFDLRPIGVADIAELHRIDMICFPPERAYSEEYFLLLFLYHDAFGWALEDEGNIAAFILCTYTPPEGYVSTIDVHPDYRRLGLASRMLAIAEDAVREMGAARIILQVEVNNEPAKTLYRKLGYRIVRHLPEYYEDGCDGYLMRKEFADA